MSVHISHWIFRCDYFYIFVSSLSCTCFDIVVISLSCRFFCNVNCNAFGSGWSQQCSRSSCFAKLKNVSCFTQTVFTTNFSDTFAARSFTLFCLFCCHMRRTKPYILMKSINWNCTRICTIAATT